MNLITDNWLPVIRASGKLEKVAPWQIAEKDDPIIELNAPRPDFQGALYQFLIGLLQTCFAPVDEEEWLDYWEKLPKEELLHEKFMNMALAYNIDDPVGPNFMQDYEDFEGEELPIEDLIGGALSDNTRHNNRDLFIKRDYIKQISPYWAAIALFNLQITGVLAWGQHRIGMRGNGPVTTIVMPTNDHTVIWKKIWLNVLTEEQSVSVPGNINKKNKEFILPWLTTTRKSHNKKATLPEHGHPLQVYWPMPRRIRLFVEDVETICDICGDKIDRVVRYYKRIKDGVFYKDGWKHPLTPYIRYNKESFPQAVTGSKISFDYRDWSSLTINGYVDDKECACAQIVSVFQAERSRDIGDSGRLWCFAYDADSAQVVRWYEARFPILCTDAARTESIRAWVNELIEAAKYHILALKQALIRAWFNPRKSRTGNDTWSHVVNKKGNIVNNSGKSIPQHLSTLHFIEENFWKDTEPSFFQMLSDVMEMADSRDRPLAIYKRWIEDIRRYSIKTFESEAFSFSAEERSIKRAVSAKKYLFNELWPAKGFLAELNELIDTI